MNTRRPLPSILALLSVSLLTGVPPTRGRAPADSVDESFNASTDGPVASVTVQTDGKILLTGSFTRVNGVARLRVARLNADGSLDPGFRAEIPPADDVVTVQGVQSDGKLSLSGLRLQDPSVQTNDFLRLNPDGSLAEGFQVKVGQYDFLLVSTVQADGRIILASTFFDLDSFPRIHRSNLSRLNPDGSPDPSFHAATQPEGVAAVAVQADGRIVLGGSADYGDHTGSNGLVARLNADGSPDVGFRAATASGVVDFPIRVRGVGVQADGKILLSGNFAAVNGVARNGIARLEADGSLDAGFNPPGLDQISRPDGGPVVVQADGKILLVGGQFTTARLNADGSLDAGFQVNADERVADAAVQANGKIILGGEFTRVNGAVHAGIARLNGDKPTGPAIFSVFGAPARGGFALTRGGNLKAPVTVFFHQGGAAVQGLDYAAFPPGVTFGAGQSEAVIPVMVLPEADRTRKVKVFLDLGPDGTYATAKAQAKVRLTDLP